MNIQTVRHGGIAVTNLTTGVIVRANCNSTDVLTVLKSDQGKINPGDIVKTPNGTRYISGPGTSESRGSVTFPAPRIRCFCQILRFTQTPEDSFGRPSPEPETITDMLPLIVQDGVFYTAPLTRQGDVLVTSDGSRYTVLGVTYENPHLSRLAIAKKF